MLNERPVPPNSSGKLDSRGPDDLIRRLADVQHGVVARQQLSGAGVTSAQIEHRIRRRRLAILHRGVYAVGHCALTGEARWMAAVLAGGPGAVLSHRSAGGLWSLRCPSGPALEITAATAHHRLGLRVVRLRLPDDELTVRDAIPVTTPARTLFDLAAVLDRHRLERAVHEAEVLRLLSPVGLPELLARHPGRRGARNLRAILEHLTDQAAAVTRSEFENRLLRVVLDAGLPRPEINAIIETADGRPEVDASWPAQRLGVELDGGAAHHTRRAFEQDRLRDRALAVAGWRTVRITWRELRDRPDRVVADLTRLLSMPPFDLRDAGEPSPSRAGPRPTRLD